MSNNAVWIPVLASMKGFIAEVNRGATQASNQAGSTLKKGLEDATKDAGKSSIEQMAVAVERQTQKISTARTAQAKAAADVEVAEQRLKAVRENQDAKASEVAMAEEKLASAKRRHETASSEIARREQDLENIRNGGKGTAESLARAEDQLARANDTAATKVGELRVQSLRLDEARDKAQAAADRVKAAEENLASARDKYGAESKEAAQAERELESAKKQAASASDQAAAAAGRVEKARAELANATDNVRSKTLNHKAAQEQVAAAERKAGDDAASAGKKIRGMGSDMDSADGSANNLTGSLAGMAGKATVAAGAFLGVQGVSNVLSSGFERLQNIERAEINFRNIGLSAEETEAQMARLSEQVTGTSVSLSDAAKYSAMFAQAGVEIGQPMDDAIQAFTNLSAAAEGTNVDVGRILQQVAANGKIDAGVLNQLSDAGVNAAQYLSDMTGKSVAEVRAMASAGEIGFQDLVTAVNSGMGDLAQEMGGTLTAKMSNAKTAFANLGAALIEPFIGAITKAVDVLTNTLKTVTPLLREIGQWASDNKGILMGVAGAFGALALGVAAYNVQAKIAAAGGIGKALLDLAKGSRIAAGAQWALNTAMWANPITWIVAAIAALVGGLVLFFTKTETGRQAWQNFTNYLGQGVDWIKAKWAEFAEKFGAFKQEYLDPMAAAIQDWVTNTVWPVLQNLGLIFQSLWNNIIKPVLGFFIALAMELGKVITSVVEAVIVPIWNFLASTIESVWNNIIKPVFDFFAAVVEILAGVLTGDFEKIGSGFKNLGESIANIVRGVIQAAMDFFKNLITMVGDAWTNFKNLVSNVVGEVGNLIGQMVSNIGEIPGQIKNLFVDAGQWLINAGRAIINGLWEGMKKAWSNVKNWLSENLSFSAVGSLVGLNAGAVVEYRQGGITEAYIEGGIRQLEAYANGGGRENHTAQIAPAGAWRVWAEPETGGEAYIPLAPSKRLRSTAILDEVARRFGYSLVDDEGKTYAGGYRGSLAPQHVTQFADGAVVSPNDLEALVQGGHGAPAPLEGYPYTWGGGLTANWGDCSGMVSGVAAYAVGQPISGRKFSTANEGSWLSSHGFIRGRGSEGDLRIGYRNGGAGGGHTSATLPTGINIEMGGARGNGQYGGGAAGAWDSYYTDFYYLPMQPAFEQVELDDLGELTMGEDPLYVSDVVGTDYASPTTYTGSSSDYGDSDYTDTSTGSQETTISGALGDLSKEIVSGHVSDILGVFGVPDTIPSWMLGGKELVDTYNANTSSNTARTSTAEESAAANHDAAVTSMTTSELQADSQLKNADNFDVVEQPTVPDWGAEFFAYEIARQAKAMNLGAEGAKIGVATALVESGDPMLMYANNAVPESLNFRHDALGSDHDSVGLFQQRNNGAWGTVAQRMDAFESAGLFFAELAKFDWRSMDPGAAAQKVQRSAFPDRYATKMGRADSLVKGTGLFDSGGVLEDEHLALNLSGKPEAVLTNDQWQLLSEFGGNLPQIVGGMTRSGVNAAGSMAIGMLNSYAPGAGAMLEPVVSVAGDYAGAVTSGWTQSVLTAAEQTAGMVMEPVRDTIGEFSAPLADATGQISAGVQEVSQKAQSAQQVPAQVIIQVQNMDQAYEAKKHQEARALAGFM